MAQFRHLLIIAPQLAIRPHMAQTQPSSDGASFPQRDVEAIERIRQEAGTLFVRWLFGPPDLHIRDDMGRPSTEVAVTIPTRSEEAEGGETRVVPAA